MQVITYTVNNERRLFETRESDDLRELITEIEAQIKERHALLQENPYLPILIADGVLNSLAANQDEVSLGELSRSELYTE